MQSAEIYGRSGGMLSFHPQGRRESQAGNKHVASGTKGAAAWFLCGLNKHRLFETNSVPSGYLAIQPAVRQ
jgi:hypothetical protein